MKILFSLLFLVFNFTNFFYSFSATDPKITFVENVIKSMTEEDKRNISECKKRLDAASKVAKMFDSDYGARIAIGKYFSDLSKEDQEKYLTKYRELVFWSQLAELNFKNGFTIHIKPEVIFINETDFDVQVYLKIIDGKDYDLKIRVRTMKDGTMKVINIIIEGVDLTLSYKIEFHSYIRSNGMANFFKRMDEIIEKGKEKHRKTCESVSGR